MSTPAPQQLNFKPLLTKKETAAFYAVTERTIDRWLLDGTLPKAAKIMIGGSSRFQTQVLLDDIASRSAETAKEGDDA